MNASAYMEHIKDTKRNIEMIELELDKIDNEMITVPALNYTPDKTQTSPRQDKLEKLVELADQKMYEEKRKKREARNETNG